MTILLLVDSLVPSFLRTSVVMAGAWILGRLGAVLLASPVHWQRFDRSLRLDDQLTTWGLAEPAVRESVMFGWLTRRLGRKLETLPTDKVRQFSRVSLGRMRYLLPLIVLLLLLRLLAPFLPPLPHGVREQPSAGGGAVQEQALAPDAPQPTHLPEPEPLPEPRPETQPLAPLIEGVEEEESFLLPSFIGEGESRPGEAPAGGLDDSSRQAKRDQSDAEPIDRAEPALGPDRFERALEKALRSRHVPPAERPFVRRYFEALLERDK